MASTSVSNPSCETDIEEGQSSLPLIQKEADEYPYPYPYPYPSHNFANINIVTVKLSGKDVYNVWKKQMLCLLRSHDMLGFIDGPFVRPFKERDMKAWIRSDSLVTGWILGSLSEKAAIRVVNRLTSKHKDEDFSARDAWDELKRIYAPSDPQQTKEANSTPEDSKSVDERKSHEVITRAHCSLYRFILRGETEKIDDKFSKITLTPTDRIMSNGNTSLHVAVGFHTSKNQGFLEKLLENIPKENDTLLNVLNSDGSTLLHVAAIAGNTEAADVLVKKDAELLFAKDNNGHTPLAISLSNMHIKLFRRLLDHIDENKSGACHTMFADTSGDEILVLAISSKDFSLSLELVQRYKTGLSEAVLMAIAQNFPCEISIWERIDQAIDYHAWKDKHCRLISSCGLDKRLRTHRDATELLQAVFKNQKKNIDSKRLSLPQNYINPFLEATKLNTVVVVTEIVKRIPDAIWCINEDGLNFIQYAVINRSEKIYSLLYQMSKHKNIYRTIKDPYGNNLLHLAGRLAPANKLNLISGAALQIQRELQWFLEVKKFVGPITSTQKNYADETPQMVFTREHMGLVIKGEEWMKATAQSYTITAALIVTIVFAAAITVPGGNNQDTGIPIHNNNIAFTMFAVSDAISLFTAVTSLLLFLTILTERFSEEDFLFKLPRRLIIGLAALFISTAAMIIAFGATLFLVFGHDNSWILIPIGVLTCLPITLFVTLQFPLIVDLTGATYVRSIFNKRKPDKYLF